MLITKTGKVKATPHQKGSRPSPARVRLNLLGLLRLDTLARFTRLVAGLLYGLHKITDSRRSSSMDNFRLLRRQIHTGINDPIDFSECSLNGGLAGGATHSPDFQLDLIRLYLVSRLELDP